MTLNRGQGETFIRKRIGDLGSQAVKRFCGGETVGH
jgi:hypothetical protein